MQLLEVDFDEVFAFDDATQEPAMSPDIWLFFTAPDKPEHYNPLLLRMLAIDQFRSAYVERYRTMLDGVFGSQSLLQPGLRNAQRLQFAYDWIARDKLWQAPYGMTMDRLLAYSQRTTDKLQWRFSNVTAHLESLGPASDLYPSARV